MSADYTLFVEPPLVKPELLAALRSAGFGEEVASDTVASDACFARVAVAMNALGLEEKAFGFDPGMRVEFWIKGQTVYEDAMRDMGRGVSAVLQALPEADVAFVHEPGVLKMKRVGGVLTASDRDGWFENRAEGFSTTLPKPDRVERLPVI